MIKYEYNNLENLSKDDIDDISKYEDYTYIPSSKIYFELELNEEPIIFCQNSTLNEKEKCYTIQYRNISKKSDNKEDLQLNPSLFIFLIDQSGSMNGNAIKVASKALLLFLQSLPAGSYYQIIGFGSKFKKYDEKPKEYTKNNIEQSIKLIEKLDADLGGTNIYSPLKDIYDSFKIYDKINLPRNIFLLTDGEIENKEDTLAIIEKNSDKFSIYSIGIGNDFDKDLIKNAGIIGKGNYNFCSNIEYLNEVIAIEVCNSCAPYISDFNIKSNLDKKNIYKMNNTNSLIIKKNKICNFNYIIEQNEENKQINKIHIDINYVENDRNKKEAKKEIKEDYEIIPNEISKGEELSKIIINDYFLKNSNLEKEEKIKLALKYQILIDDTSLFAEIELSKKISEEMKSKIIGNKKDNIILRPKYLDYDYEKSFIRGAAPKNYHKSTKMKLASYLPKIDFSFFTSIGSTIKNIFWKNKQNSEENMESLPEPKVDDFKDNCEYNKIYEKEKKEEKEEKEKKGINKDDLNKEDLMKMINTQDFVSGFWDINEQTKIIKKKYEKEFESLKKIKDGKLDDKIIMTILIIYFINKEHSELLKEFVMIIKKGKSFIQEKTEETYENILKEIGVN